MRDTTVFNLEPRANDSIYGEIVCASPTPRRTSLATWLLLVKMFAAVVMLLIVIAQAFACAHTPSPAAAIGVARKDLGTVGAAFTGLSIAFEAAVDARAEVCKHQLPSDATIDARKACLGPLASDGRIATDLARVHAVYDDAADALAELEALVASLTRALAEAEQP